jgi:pimeloyl-ACP methyl ester carboxylesterase
MSITLESPANNAVTMNNQPDFGFTATHSSNPTLSCTLWLKLTPSGTPTAYGTNGSVVNGAPTIIMPSSPIPNGQYQWWINCSDGATSIIGEKRTITVNVIRGTRSFTASNDGSTRYYWLDLPDHFDSSVPTPLVIFLHGYGQDRTCYDTYYPGLEQIFRQNGWMVACPECRTISGYSAWYTEPSRSDITDVINLLEQEFTVDRSHIHVIGTSMGGSGTLQYAMFNPQIIASVCPVMGVTNFTEFYNWPQVDPTLKTSISTAFGGTPSQVPQVYNNESPLGNEIRFMHMPVFLLHGSADTVVPVSNSRNLNASLTRAGYVVKYVEVPGVGHYGTDLIGGREQMIYEWFRDHPLYASIHLLLTPNPIQDSYVSGQSVSFAVSVFNQRNPKFGSSLTLTVTGPGNYGYFEVQPMSVVAGAVEEYSFSWVVPNVAGKYVVEVELAPSMLTAFDTAWLKVN